MRKPTISSQKCSDDEKKHEVVKMSKGPWSPEEDQKLVDFIRSNKGFAGNWRSLPKLAGILRCGKSCRLRWTNYLRPDIKRGPFSMEENKTIKQLHALLGNRWAAIAARLPGRTDNDVKNYWISHLKKQKSAISHETIAQPRSPTTRHLVQWEGVRLETEARLTVESLLYPSGYSTTICDPFLRLWNSEVGEFFRNIGGRQAVSKCQVSSSTEGCSSTKCGSGSGVTGHFEQKPIVNGYFQELQHSTYIDSEDTADCSDTTAMDMLLDSPTSD